MANDYYQRNREKILALRKAYRAANLEKAREAVRRCWSDPEKGEKYLEKRAIWYETYAPIARQRAKDWNAAHPEVQRNRSNSHNQRKARQQRTPKWLTSEDRWLIAEAYHLARLRTKTLGYEWHVDHIIPLRGKRVSGLHVPTNLQVITGKENRIKAGAC